MPGPTTGPPWWPSLTKPPWWLSLTKPRDPSSSSGTSAPHVLDRWLASARNTLVKQVTEALEDFDTQRAGALLATFVDDLSNWYVRRSRRRFWVGSDGALQTLHDTLDVVTRLMAPLAPFVTERVWQDLMVTTDPTGPASVHLATWPEVDEAAIDRAGRGHAADPADRRARPFGPRRGEGEDPAAFEPCPDPFAAFGLLDAEMLAESDGGTERRARGVVRLRRRPGDYSAKGTSAPSASGSASKTPLVAAAIASADASVLSADLSTHGHANVLVTDLGEVEVTPDEVIVSERPREGWSVVNEQVKTVALDLELSPELLEAGLAREVIRGCRRLGSLPASGCPTGSSCVWSASRDATTAAIRTYTGLIGEEVLATTVAESEPAEDWFTDAETRAPVRCLRGGPGLMAEPQRPTPVVFLHSAGLTPQMWQSQVEAVAAAEAEGAETQVIAPWLAGLRPGRPASCRSRTPPWTWSTSWTGTGSRRPGSSATSWRDGSAGGGSHGTGSGGRARALRRPGITGRVALAMQKGLIRMLPNRAFAESGATKEDLLRALDVIASADLGRRLAEITVPVLVVAGAADPALAAAKLLVQRLPDARLVEIPGAGANPNLERPDAYNQALTAYLASDPSGT